MKRKSKPTAFFMPITKRDDEQRMVWGYASTEALDSDGEIITKEAMENALDDYMKFGAVREMHQHWSAGRTKEADFDDKGLYIGVKIVDDQAWEKIKEGVYNGFSVGGESQARIGNKITSMTLKEISLVDRPANPEALFEVFKMDKSKNEIKKSMSTLGQLCFLYDQFDSLRGSVKWEEEMESDTASILPALMDDACSKIGEIILAMASEEIAESNPQGEIMTDAEKIAKAEGDAKEIADRKAKMKEAIAERLKTYKECAEEMQSAHDGMDDATKEAMDSFDDKLTNLWPVAGQTHKAEGEDGEEANAEEENAEGEPAEEKNKISKSIKSIVDRAIAKAMKDAKPADHVNVAKLNDTITKLNEKIEKLGSTVQPPKTLRTIEKDGKVDIAKMAKENPKGLDEKIASGEITREEAFKQILAGSPRVNIS